MTIARPTESRDGKLRSTIRIAFRVSREDLAVALVLHVAEEDYYRPVHVQTVEDAIRASLHAHGSEFRVTRDLDESEQDALDSWAREQVARLYPTLADEA